MTNKKGQFFIIGAIVIITVIISIATITNYTREKNAVKLYDLGEELGIESQQVLEFGTYNGLDQEAMKDLMETFIQNYVSYIEEKKNIYFVFGNKQAINIIGYQEVVEEKVCVDVNPTETCGDNIVEENEECDDGNILNDDGCDSSCKIESTEEGLEKCDAESIAEEPCCNNDVKELGEKCDGADLGENTCVSMGFESGTLYCNSDCEIDVSDCVKKERECTEYVDLGTTQEFSNNGDDITKVVISIANIDYEFSLKEGENFYFVIWQEIGGEKHVVTNE